MPVLKCPRRDAEYDEVMFTSADREPPSVPEAQAPASTAVHDHFDGGTDTSDDTVEAIRQVLEDHARLPAGASVLDEGDDLFQAGMTSHASVNVMLALEDRFDIEFPDAMLKRSAFESISAIATAVIQLQTEPA